MTHPNDVRTAIERAVIILAVEGTKLRDYIRASDLELTPLLQQALDLFDSCLLEIRESETSTRH